MSTSHCIYTISSIIIRTNQQQLKTCNIQNIIITNVRTNRIAPINYKQTAIVIYITKQISHTRRGTWWKGIIKSFILSIAYILNSPIISVLTTAYYCWEITSYWFDVQKRANFKQLFCATCRFPNSYLTYMQFAAGIMSYFLFHGIKVS
jgi:hypothetical protein